MNWPLILNITALSFTAGAALFSFKNKKTVAIILTLSAAVVNGTAIIIQKRDHSEKIPAITASNFGNYIRIAVVNVDSEYPLKDASFKIDNLPAIELGTLYPQVVNTVRELEIPKTNTTWISTLWYNDSQSIETDFKITLNSDSTISITTTYLNNKGEEFVPSWKNYANNNTDSVVQHYNPRLFK